VTCALSLKERKPAKRDVISGGNSSRQMDVIVLEPHEAMIDVERIDLLGWQRSLKQ